MPTLTLSAKEPAAAKADALIVGVVRGPSGPRLYGADRLPAPLRRSLTAALPGLGVTGAADELVRIPAGTGVAAPVLVLTGLGPAPAGRAPVGAETLRRAAGAAARSLAGTAAIALALPAEDLGAIAAVAEGALFGAYTFTRYRTGDGAGTKPPVQAIQVLTGRARTGPARAAAHRAGIIGQAVAATRDLVNTAPVDLYPAAFAEAATAAAAGLPIRVTVLDEKKLQRGGYGGLIAVGMGSARPPRLVRLDYAPDGARSHLALVGKGITFDSGGLSIKPAQGMEAMKSDMSGAAAVLNAVVAAARLGLPLRLTGWLALAENMPSGSAQRPSDVITIRGGRTVEVLNTDAEGRLVLADALVAASESGPDAIVDVATLTGAQMVALGNRTSAIMANQDALRERVHRVSAEVGEQFWPMPLPQELRASMDSAVADIANIGERYGGMLVAGLFLAEFVGKAGAGADGDSSGAGPIPWAHLDIAGPAFNTGTAHGYTPVGGTGVAVRTLLGLAEDLARSGI